MARAWYEKAAAQGNARSMIDLAALLERTSAQPFRTSSPTSELAKRVSNLISQAAGGTGVGLSVQRAEPLRVDFVSPSQAAPVPGVPSRANVVVVSAGDLEVVARVVGSSKVTSVRVNGVPQGLNSGGMLNIPVTVGATGSKISVEADDESGARAQAELTLVPRSAPVFHAAASEAAASSPGTESNASISSSDSLLSPGKRIALLIANENYQHWEKLDTPQADAIAVAEVLKRHFGFDVSVIQDATRQQLLGELGRLRQRVGPQDQVLVYFAGHGHMDSVTARGYWIPVDGDAKDLSRWVSVIDVTDQLSAMTARQVLVVADSCYSGTLTRSLVPVVDQALSLPQRLAPLAQLGRQRARVALTSGGLEPVADGGSAGHSLFARSLLDVLEQVNAPVAAQELHQAVAARFAALARRMKLPQQPQFAPIAFAGHEAGDFVFLPNGPGAAP